MGLQSLGVDFGTSNSTVAAATATAARPLRVEGDAPTIPSAVFFDFANGDRLYGRAALNAYVNDENGRFMKGLKSILGSDLMDSITTIRRERLSYSDIIAGFVSALKARADTQLTSPARAVVAGRPVHFVDDDPAADAAAQDSLFAIFQAAGFDTVTFQYEPIAAALDYEQTAAAEQTVLIADLGGGTADFCIVRVGPDRAARPDRADDILATAGVHIGGTDFDRLISVNRVMPLLGLGSAMRRDFADGTLTIPRRIFMALSTWQHIHRLYDSATQREVRDYRRLSEAPERIDRLALVLEERLGHQLILAVEDAKIDLTGDDASTIALDAVETGLAAPLTRPMLDELIADSVSRLNGALAGCLSDSGLTSTDMDAVFFTGGTAAIPLVRDTLKNAIPGAVVIDGDRFASVGTGLALEARRRFGPANLAD